MAVENVINGVRAAVELGFSPVCISIETRDKNVFTYDELISNSYIKEGIKQGKILTINASWMDFKREADRLNGGYRRTKILTDTKRPCQNVYTGITINPYSQMLACCGLTVEYNPYLKLGSVENYSIKELYDNQFNDFFKFWLYVDGPEHIYEEIIKKRNVEKLFFPHECAYCMELIKKENLEYLKEIIKEEFPSIIYKYQLNRNSYEK